MESEMTDALVSSAAPMRGRRDALRRLAFWGLSAATATGIATLSVRGFARYGAADGVASFTKISHQLGWLKGVQFGGDFMAQDLGYFADEGLEVHYTAGGPGTDYRTIVSSGRALVSESNPPGMVDGYLHGQPLVAFAAVMQRDPAAFMSSAAKPIRSLRDMIGKTIGVTDNIRSQITALLRRASIDPAQVHFVPIGSDPGQLITGQVDAYFNWATTGVPPLRRAGFEPYVLHLSDIGVPSYGGVLIARRDHLEQEHDTFVRYTRALKKGWRWMVDHPDETAEIMVRKYAPIGTNLQEQIAEAGLMRDYILSGDALTKGLLWIDPAVFQGSVALAREAGVIGPGVEIDVSQFVTQSVVEAAAGSA
jgi:NitT/TauT family transport system substrate-binding protein